MQYPACNGHYKTEKSHRSHWNLKHRGELGDYSGPGAFVEVADAIPLQPLSIDNIKTLSMESFDKCRVTPDGVIDAIAIFTGSTALVAATTNSMILETVNLTQCEGHTRSMIFITLR